MTQKSSQRPFSASKMLKVKTDDESGHDALESAEDRQDKADIARMEMRIIEAQANDKIGSIVGYGPYAMDQTPTQVFGSGLIESCKNDVSKIPDWRFTRWYFRDKIIVDLFRTKQKYQEADVEARRRMAKKYGLRYAALGPSMSYKTDLPQQLGI